MGPDQRPEQFFRVPGAVKSSGDLPRCFFILRSPYSHVRTSFPVGVYVVSGFKHGTWTEIGPLLRLLLYLNQQRRPGRGLPRQGGATAPDRVAAAEGIREIFPFKNEGLEIVYTFSRLSNNFS